MAPGVPVSNGEQTRTALSSSLNGIVAETGFEPATPTYCNLKTWMNGARPLDGTHPAVPSSLLRQRCVRSAWSVPRWLRTPTVWDLPVSGASAHVVCRSDDGQFHGSVREYLSHRASHGGRGSRRTIGRNRARERRHIRLKAFLTCAGYIWIRIKLNRDEV